MNLAQDLKVVLRRLQRHAGTSFLIVMTLALVLGANTMTFSFVNEILLNPLPAVAKKDSLVNVHGWRDEKEGLESFSYPAFRALSETNLFESGLVGFNGRGLSLQRGSGAELVFGMLVSDNYFDALGIRMRAGRGLVPQDNRTGAAGVVVLSDGIWRARFGADPGVLGSAIRLNGRAFTVVGIGPPRFSGHFVGFAADLWLPLAWAPTVSGQADLLESAQTNWIEAFGRLKPGTRLAAAPTLSRILAGLPSADKAAATRERILIEPLTGIDRDLRGPVAAFLALLQGATLIVALIAMANISSLLMARGLERRQETAVRLALGASRRNLLTPLALEAIVLSGAGSAIGLVLALAVARVAPGWLPPFAIPLRFDIALDVRVFAFSAFAGLVGAAIAALGPGVATARSQPATVLREGGGQRTTRSRWSSFLVITQVAFATMILVSGSAFTRFLLSAAEVAPGFDLDRLQITRLDASVLGLSGPDARSLQLRASDAVSALAGVERAAFARVAPFSLGTLTLDARDATAGEGATWTRADWNAISSGFFETTGVRILKGRAFSNFDDALAPRVIVLSEGLEKRLFPGGDAMGRTVRLGASGAAGDVATVVGVVADVSWRRLGEAPRPQIYRPFDQAPSPRITLLARSTNPQALAPLIRAALRQASPDLPLLESLPLRDFASFSQAGVRLGSEAGVALGLLGLGLAAVGLFGLVAATVASRVREIAIRMALGATSARILSLILREGTVLGLAGLGLGLAGAFGVSPLVATLAPGVQATDPVALLGASSVVAAVVAFAVIGPAWRASRTAPAVALRTI